MYAVEILLIFQRRRPGGFLGLYTGSDFLRAFLRFKLRPIFGFFDSFLGSDDFFGKATNGYTRTCGFLIRKLGISLILFLVLAMAPGDPFEELATNPFLRARDPALKQALGMENAPDADVFAMLRSRKDNF